MDWDQLELNPRIIASVRRVKLKSVREALCVSGPDLQRLTGLSRSDVQQLKTAAAVACRRHPPTPAVLLQGGYSGLRLSVGCPVLDQLLRGGLPAGGVTELSGESGAGKTQLALQLCLSVQYPAQHGGLDSGRSSTQPSTVVWTQVGPVPSPARWSGLRSIPSPPISRSSILYLSFHCYLGQRFLRVLSILALIHGSFLLHSSTARPYHPSHATLRAYHPQASTQDVSECASLSCVSLQDVLSVCLSRRVPLLLARQHVRLVVVDSVAALFRSEFQASDWLERSKQLISFSHTLHTLSLEFNTPVLCINQVTDVFSSDDSLGPVSGAVAPALGLVWANQVMVRLMMRRLQGTVARGDQSSTLRRLEVVFAPHLARDGRDAAVWREGVLGVARSDYNTRTDV
ncbi:DNA repair protein XRCC3 [Perca fluviatilis]|uniref:DNA repair protein XRCC3 n=1 Tax=Perca fluviatilis TaxID=8168 RepID=UPI0019661288|nr:DNA repair protein XRCC3 [Perca fluviatilis]